MGSTVLLPMVKLAAAGYMENHPAVTVNVSGGGSFTGLTQVSTGGVHIGNSDVEATPDLLKSGLVDHRVAVAPFVIIVNPGVKVNNLTREQAVAIFTGRIKNWKEVGGENLPLIIIHRPRSTGSRATIKQVVLGGREFTDQAIIQDSNGLVRSSIAGTPGAIGYVDAAYLNKSVKVLKYDGVAFTSQAVVAGRYPIYTFEHMYTKGEATGAVKDFLAYILSREFQTMQVRKLGFIPVAAVKQ
jgi:phosphate transport system substrate-binding protein